MIVRPITPQEKTMYNRAVHHPLQSYEWGEFRKKTGQGVERLGIFEGEKLVAGYQVTFHTVPKIKKMVGYFPKGPMPDEQMLNTLTELGKRHNAIFIKMEPNVSASVNGVSGHDTIGKFLIDHGCVPGKPLFTKYTFLMDLSKSEDEILEGMRPKTRYNIKVAQKKGVEVVEDSTMSGLEEYLRILKETTNRQQFYAHDDTYFKTMWETMEGTGLAHIFKAVYQGQTLAIWVVFIFNGKLYYPYGASSRENRDVMANNLLAWEVIRFGKKEGCTSFDMWGSLGPEPDPKDPWYGFHRFKEGYGGQLTQFLGTYDLIIDPPLYKLFTVAEEWRWKALRFKAKLGL